MRNKNKFGSIIIRSFIVIAVLRKNAFCIFPKMLGKCGSTFRRMLMMLISVMPGEGRKASETTITYEESRKWLKTN